MPWQPQSAADGVGDAGMIEFTALLMLEDNKVLFRRVAAAVAETGARALAQMKRGRADDDSEAGPPPKRQRCGPPSTARSRN